MLCSYCNGHIGVFRRLTDNQFCCAEHRVKMAARSARALRNSRESEFYDDEASAVFVKRINVAAPSKPQQQASVSSSLVFGLLLVSAIYIGSLGLPDNGGAPPPREAAEAAPSRSSFGSPFTVRRTDDFKNGIASWSGSAKDWRIKDGLLQPGSLRIWSESVGMRNYNVEFAGQIERKALSWAFRARDNRNYYAAQLLISKPGPVPTVDLVRYAVIDGHQISRTRVPLPLPNLRQETLYKVQMTVKGSDFSAIVNGKMVDSWSDTRLTAGGIGFFAEAGEAALLRYVTLSESDTLMGRLLSHFGLIHPLLR